MYKLLIFNQDWADEHNVPALACFTEIEFEDWKISRLGKENLNYETELLDHQKKVAAWNNFVKEIDKKGFTKGVPNTQEEKRWWKENRVEYVSEYDKPKKGTSYLTAYLGNNGDGFSEDYDNYLTGQDFLETNIVSVHDVSEDFYETFKKVGLNHLSLCNIFER